MDQELYKFRAIIGHEGPSKATYPNWKGANIMFQLNRKLEKSLLNP